MPGTVASAALCHGAWCLATAAGAFCLAWRPVLQRCAVLRVHALCLSTFLASSLPVGLLVLLPPLRPACSDKERARGDREVWECSGNAVGILEDVGMKVGGARASPQGPSASAAAASCRRQRPSYLLSVRCLRHSAGGQLAVCITVGARGHSAACWPQRKARLF